MAKKKKFTFWVPGPLPGMNEIVAAAKSRHRGGRTGYSAMKKEITAMVKAICINDDLPMVESADIFFDWMEKARTRDKDNISCGNKFILDGMVKAGIIKNDGWKQIGRLVHDFHVGQRPGVRVTVQEI